MPMIPLSHSYIVFSKRIGYVFKRNYILPNYVGDRQFKEQFNQSNAHLSNPGTMEQEPIKPSKYAD